MKAQMKAALRAKTQGGKVFARRGPDPQQTSGAAS